VDALIGPGRDFVMSYGGGGGGDDGPVVQPDPYYSEGEEGGGEGAGEGDGEADESDYRLIEVDMP
jgi:hypothetical protein